MRKNMLLNQVKFAKWGESFQNITLPHTWNNLDGQDGGNDYWRGIGTYEIDLPNPTSGKRQYIEIQGANHVATVYCNGRELGTHKGGFSTFRFELTSAMKPARNVLQVVVTNAESDIYPQIADFTFFGGLYRDVNFIEVEEAHFDLMKDGTSGVFVTPHCSGKTRLDLFPVNADGFFVSVELVDEEGYIVGKGAASASKHVDMIIDIDKPHLWNGLADPYCYKAVARLIKDDVVTDEVEIIYGYRSFHVDPNTGFWLNGKNVPLRGVCRHQDRLDKGWAISKEDHEEDAALIKEVGANALRLAHYQHDQYFYELCDKCGFAVWAEIPFISKFMDSEEAYENSLSQMRELIAQNYNHPSIFFWGIANEILIGPDNEPVRRNLLALHVLAKKMDPSRLTTTAEVAQTPMDSEHMYITDLVGYNYYFGWYGGDVSQNGPKLDAFHEMNPSVPIGLSEYGAENLVRWHSATPVNHDYTEEYASYYHHEMLKLFEIKPYLWGTFQWNCFDFAADARNEGGVIGRNNKGLITYDRKLKKDAFYIYKAYWNPEPMVHVAGRRFVDRAPEERNITVYTNCDEVTLVVNGVSFATKMTVDHEVVFENVELHNGENVVTAVADGVEDTIILNGVDVHNPSYTLPDLAEAMKTGNWFDEIVGNDDSEDIEVIDGYFSIKDTANELLGNEECFKLIKAWFIKQGNMAIASMLTSLGDMVGFRDFKGFAAVFADEFPEKEFANLNRMLVKIKK